MERQDRKRAEGNIASGGIRRGFTRECAATTLARKKKKKTSPLSLSFSPPTVWWSPSVDLERPFNTITGSLPCVSQKRLFVSSICCTVTVETRRSVRLARSGAAHPALLLDKNVRGTCITRWSYLSRKRRILPLSFYHGRLCFRPRSEREPR